MPWPTFFFMQQEEKNTRYTEEREGCSLCYFSIARRTLLSSNVAKWAPFLSRTYIEISSFSHLHPPPDLFACSSSGREVKKAFKCKSGFPLREDFFSSFLRQFASWEREERIKVCRGKKRCLQHTREKKGMVVSRACSSERKSHNCNGGRWARTC